MKTEQEIKEELKNRRRMLRETQKQFDRYDNHDDMEQLPILEGEIMILKWVLE